MSSSTFPAAGRVAGALARLVSRRRATRLLVVVGIIASLGAPAIATGHYAHSKFSYGETNDDDKIDPVTFALMGSV